MFLMTPICLSPVCHSVTNLTVLLHKTFEEEKIENITFCEVRDMYNRYYMFHRILYFRLSLIWSESTIFKFLTTLKEKNFIFLTKVLLFAKINCGEYYYSNVYIGRDWYIQYSCKNGRHIAIVVYLILFIYVLV